jgi:hypothetical protein
VNSFSYDPTTGALSVMGYAPAELSDLLAVYREHMRLQADLVAELGFGADAVRYAPSSDLDDTGPRDV